MPGSAPLCPFCHPDPGRVFHEDEVVVGLWDAFAVSPGHALLVPRRHVATWFDATHEEREALTRATEVARRRIEERHRPDGYNIGINVGAAGGQTVFHLHVHVIPRYAGDVPDARGGVRHVLPAKANYLAAAVPPAERASPLTTGGSADPFARHVLPLFDRASRIAIVAAFVQESGIRRIASSIQAALARGAAVRLITGDYLDITQASALETLLDWQQATSIDDEGQRPAGRFESRVVEVPVAPGSSFHPKSWLFESDEFGAAFVGSSNLSRAALETGTEWNLRVDRHRDPVAFARIGAAFEEAWGGARVLDAAWVEQYAARAREALRPLPPGDAEAEPFVAPPEPHAVQVEALEALRLARAEGRRRALVVLATGLGKTWLAAFDWNALRAESGARPRLLFVAHRQELLRQASETYRTLVRASGAGGRVGWFVDERDDLSADLVFASVAKLARPENLARLRAERFDYVVVDEVHHAAASSYRRILDAVDPRFLLGLTATPDRADSADILGLFDDFVAYRADVGRGVAIGRLVPFRYHGVKDDIDYANLPWRNRRFDAEALATAAQTEARMETLWRAWNAHPGTRSLVFCCSIAHAGFVRAWLRAKGVRVAAVWAGAGSDDREEALAAFHRGELDALCAIDVFNEGVDVPAIDRVVMLRPTESSVVFLQQLGRGLRADDGKAFVTVIDFVGNHRVFLERMRTLLSLAGTQRPDVRALLAASGAVELPAGCSVELELEAKDLLSRLFRSGGADEVERAYRDLRDEREERPTAGELQRMGYLPSRLRERHVSWFGFVATEGDLPAHEAAVAAAASDFLREVETTEMTRCFKMVTLEALLESDALVSGLSVRDVAVRSHAILRRSPELWADVVADERADELDAVRERRWLAYWRRNPIAAWTEQRPPRRAWFRLDGGLLRLDAPVEPGAEETLGRLVRELVDYRLAQYRARKRQSVASAEGFVCKVISNQRDPILKLPSRATSTLPEGETDVRLPDGSVWQFRMMKEYCNVARPPGAARNQLPDLLRKWFGPSVGKPGTAFEVRFHASPDGLWVEPVQATVAELAPRQGVVVYPDLRAAAGHAVESVVVGDAERVSLPLGSPDPSLFAVRVAGTSMDGGLAPLHDGDWAVLSLARGAATPSLEGRVVLIETPGSAVGSQYQLKRLKRQGDRWILASDNPDGPTIDVRPDSVAIARLQASFTPEQLAPPIGATLEDAALAAAFGLDELPTRSGRHDGHLFVFVDAKGVLVATNRLRHLGTPRPSETAFVLARRDDGAWRYLGVARQTEDAGLWSLPDVDFATWRAWGEGREVSRPLPEGALARAQQAAAAVLALPEAERWIERSGGTRARILGTAQRGGLRVDGGEGGFHERTVSVTDLAWVIVADVDVEAKGGLLDEERVNRLRYLEGTPKASTRWIDTGWAMAAWAKAKDLVRDGVEAGAT